MKFSILCLWACGLRPAVGLPLLHGVTSPDLQLLANSSFLHSATAEGSNRRDGPLPRPRIKYPKAGDAVWGADVGRGCKLLQMMTGTDREAAELFEPSIGPSASSNLRNYPQTFTDWGYTDTRKAAMDVFEWGEYGAAMDDALKALKIDPSYEKPDSPNVILGRTHTDVTNHDGVEYKATGAKYFTVINANAGMIVGYWKFSPASEGPNQKPPVDPKTDPLPELRRWSDVAYLKWASEATRLQKPIDSLRYIVSSPVENSETKAIIARAMDSDKQPPNWPARKVFRMNTEEGKAILGSPNGRGAALLLIQHKDTMGEHTSIEKVEVWCDNVLGAPSLLFYVTKSQVANDEAHGEVRNNGFET